jgi:hypothetical protein
MFEINGIVYANTPTAMMKITEAKITGDKMMLLTFSSGEKRVFDARILNGEVYKPLDDNKVFSDFTISHGAVTWMDGEIDCAPEYMYENSYDYSVAI